ncbi:MAG: nitrous oxide reductase family maturation protein NosD [Sulfurospirillaceae bacterium]|jgi:nitrous oxidase accessory protein|nr:nitrous oxide reductase family maturation protein NosD [Sulfurospirillaceae bacterium]NLN00137.1 nitrous oxide reductase family maturation protein NosD [Campylobacteraceae bacterium]
MILRWLSIWFFSLVLLFANPLQEAIDAAPRGAVIELEPGEYHGNITISKPITIDGKDQSAHIVGEQKGSIISIKSSNVVIKNLTIRGSGDSHEKIDSAIVAVDSNYITIENNHIEDALFGIDLQQVNRSKVINNYITSKPYALGLRGDGIRLWYAHDNVVSDNTLHKSRDLVVWYSSGNEIDRNYGEYGRYSLHFMYAGKNLVRDNEFRYNSVGIFFMYSSGTVATGNIVRNSIGAFGVGLGMKDASGFTIEDNIMIYNARGIFNDQSPFQPDQPNIYKRNKILYNSSGLEFQGIREASIFIDNTIKGNMEPVVNADSVNNLHMNEWKNNYWDTYEGYDLNKDGIGDIPFNHYSYADRLWSYKPSIKFFYGSVVIDLLNFLAKMAPFSEPELLATDLEPLMEPYGAKTSK